MAKMLRKEQILCPRFVTAFVARRTGEELKTERKSGLNELCFERLVDLPSE